jgi:hypothetical protein
MENFEFVDVVPVNKECDGPINPKVTDENHSDA